MSDTPPFRDMLWDDEREASSAARAILFKSYVIVELWLHDNAHRISLDHDYVCDLHRRLFSGVFPYLAGKVRHGAAGFEFPSEFGEDMRGTPYLDLPDQLKDWSANVKRDIGDLDRFLDEDSPPRHAENVVRAAAYAHCGLTAMHPFVNGNGRTARVCVNYFAYRYNLRPIAVERDKEDRAYISAANDWLRYGRADPFVEYLHQRMV